MPTFTDFITAMMAGSTGNVEAFQKYGTAAGRKEVEEDRRLAAGQRAITQLQQKTLQDVLQRAQTDPTVNAMLQQALGPGIINEMNRSATAGQNLQNENTAAENRSFPEGKATADFQQRERQLGIGQQQGERQLDLTERGQDIGQQQQANEMLMQFLGLQQRSDLGGQELKSRQTIAAEDRVSAEKIARGRTAADFAQGLYPETPMSPEKRELARQVGLDLGPDPKQVADQKAAQGVWEYVKQKFGGGQPTQEKPTPSLTPRPTAPRQPQAPFPGLGGPMLEPSITQDPLDFAKRTALQKLGFDPQASNLQRALDILRALTQGSVDVELPNRGR